jgi:hypothetical protein
VDPGGGMRLGDRDHGILVAAEEVLELTQVRGEAVRVLGLLGRDAPRGQLGRVPRALGGDPDAMELRIARALRVVERVDPALEPAPRL